MNTLIGTIASRSVCIYSWEDRYFNFRFVIFFSALFGLKPKPRINPLTQLYPNKPHSRLPWIKFELHIQSTINKTKYTIDPGIQFLMKLMKIMIKSTKDSLIRTYFLIYPLISKCQNLKMLSKNSFHGLLISSTI